MPKYHQLIVSPKHPFRPKIRKCSLALISACVSRGERDWLESRSEENKIVAVVGEICLSCRFVRENEDDYENVETMHDKRVATVGGESCSYRNSSGTLNLLVKSGIWPGKAELAISHPFARKISELANPRKRAKAFRLYARLVDSTPVLRPGCWHHCSSYGHCAMDVAASKKVKRRHQCVCRADYGRNRDWREHARDTTIIYARRRRC